MKINVDIELPLEADGMLLRQCPECKGLFKIAGKQELPSEDLRCPYCRHREKSFLFYTDAQREWAQKEAFLHGLEKDADMKKYIVSPSYEDYQKKYPNRYWYREEEGGEAFFIDESCFSLEELAQKPVCNHCGLPFVVYGFYSGCPYCESKAAPGNREPSPIA